MNTIRTICSKCGNELDSTYSEFQPGCNDPALSITMCEYCIDDEVCESIGTRDENAIEDIAFLLKELLENIPEEYLKWTLIKLQKDLEICKVYEAKEYIKVLEGVV